MLIDGDGRPIPPVGSKVRFFYVRPGYRVFVTEGVIAKHNTTSFDLAEGYKTFVDGEWSTFNHGRSYSIPTTIPYLHGMTILEPNKGIANYGDGSKTSEGSDFSHFFLSDFLADLQLKCEEETFHVHKVILAAGSPYFQAMFQNDMTEARSGCIELREIKPNVLKTALKWIYTNKIDVKDFKDDPDFAGNLISTAEMYQLKKLKRIVEGELSDTIQLENVLEMLVIGDRYGATKMKEKALKMIAEKMKEVVKLDDWRKFIVAYPSLTFEITTML